MDDFDALVIVETADLNEHVGKVSLMQKTMRETYDHDHVPWALPKEVVGVLHTARMGTEMRGTLASSAPSR